MPAGGSIEKWNRVTDIYVLNLAMQSLFVAWGQVAVADRGLYVRLPSIAMRFVGFLDIAMMRLNLYIIISSLACSVSVEECVIYM